MKDVVARFFRPGQGFFDSSAIVGAEHILRWLPKGTHQYEKLVRPEEIDAALAPTGMEVIERTGVTYNQLADRWARSRDMDVNYMVLAERPKLNL